MERTRAPRVVASAALAGVLVGALGALLFPGRSRPDARPSPTRFTVTLPDVVEKPGDGIRGLAVSPDGRTLAISSSAGRGGIHLRELGQAEARLLPATESATDLCFSPDGRSIAFFKADVRSLWRLALDGGAPQMVRAQLYQAGMAWSPDGRLVTNAPTADSGIYALDPDDLSTAPLSDLDTKAGDQAHASPCFLPGGRAMLYTVWKGPDSAEGRIDLVDLDTREQRTVQHNATTPGYLSFSDGEGALLYYRDAAYWARRFDPRTLQCRGDEVPVAEGVQMDPNIGEAMLAVSPAGTLAYQPRVDGLGGSRLFWVTRDGREEPATSETSDHQTPSLSADGQLLSFGRGGATPRVYLVDLRAELAARTPRRLGYEPGFSAGCVLSPDGTRAAYLTSDEATYRVVVRGLLGGEAARVIAVGDSMPRSWSPDGRWLAMMGPGAQGAEVQIAPADASSPARPFVQAKGNAYDPHFSPDGRWIAYVSDEDGAAEVFVAGFPDGNRRVQVTNGGGTSPRWALDGSELYFRREDGFYAVPVKPEPEPGFGTPKLMFRGEYDPEFFHIGFLPGPDGRFLMNKPLLPSERTLRVVVVEGFGEEVRAKLAAIEAR